MQIEEIIRKIISGLLANPYLALMLTVLFLTAFYLIYKLVHKPKIMRYMGAEPIAMDNSKLRPVREPITSWQLDSPASPTNSTNSTTDL